MLGTRVLVVDDDPNIREVVTMGLRFAGYQVATASSGHQAVDAARAGEHDLAILDVMLPDIDGFTVLRRLREVGARIPTIFLTARDDVEDRVNGLAIGGDDYMTKPFSLEELVLRVEAVLRRHEYALPRAHARAQERQRVACADVLLDEASHDVWRSDQPIELSATEFALLHYLLVNEGRVVTRGQILDHVWGYDFDGHSNVVDSYIRYLRKKIDSHGPPLIHTIRGVGYIIRAPR